MNNILLFIGIPEIMLLLLAALLLFGSKSIPELSRTLGKGIREFNKIKSDFSREINTIQDPGPAKNPTKMAKSLAPVKSEEPENALADENTDDKDLTQTPVVDEEASKDIKS